MKALLKPSLPFPILLVVSLLLVLMIIVKFELREKGLFVEAVFYRPISETVAKPSDTVGKVSDNLIPLSFQEETIIAYIEQYKRIVSKDVEKLLGIKESRTRELLKQMVEKGLIVRLGRGRSTCYMLGNNKI